MRLARGPDDADVIRARLRALLDDGRGSGWVPEDLEPAPSTSPAAEPAEHGPGAADPDDVDPDDVDPGAPGGDLAAAGRHRAGGPVARLDPGRPGARALWLAAAAAVLVLLLLTWRDRPVAAPVVPAGPSATSAPESPAAASAAASAAGDGASRTPATVVVSVVGRVARPGLVTLPEGARVADAVEAAGGLLPGADAAGVNLAALLADGQQVAVGVPGADPPPGPAGAPAGAAGSAVDLNAAGTAELEDLPGLGPVLAQRIVDHRAEHGPFTAVEDLLDVPGIGPAILDGLVDAATV